jgi:hypothetical protein
MWMRYGLAASRHLDLKGKRHSAMNYDSKFLSENQHEQNDFAILAYQKSFENVSLQLAAFTRYSSTLFTPDNAGNLYTAMSKGRGRLGRRRQRSKDDNTKTGFSCMPAGVNLYTLFVAEHFLQLFTTL